MHLKQILVVDDDPKVLLILRATLTQMQRGYGIQTASDGLTALQIVKQTTFDLVITDIIMPGMDGIDFVEELRAINPDTAVIWITAFGCHDLSEECAQLNVFRCLEKPLRIGKIRQAILSALETPAQSPENQRSRRKTHEIEN